MKIRVMTTVEILQGTPLGEVKMGDRIVWANTEERSLQTGDNPRFLHSDFVTVAHGLAENIENTLKNRFGEAP